MGIKATLLAGFCGATAPPAPDPYGNALKNYAQVLSGGGGGVGTYPISTRELMKNPSEMYFSMKEIANGYLVGVGGKEHYCKELADIGSVISAAWAAHILGE